MSAFHDIVELVVVPQRERLAMSNGDAETSRDRLGTTVERVQPLSARR